MNEAQTPIDDTLTQVQIELAKIDIELKRAELARNSRAWRAIFTNPVVIGAFITAYIALMGALVSFSSSSAQTDIARANNLLEEKKFRFSVVIEAIKTGNPDAARQNLLTFLNVGFLDDPGGRLRDYLEARKPGEGPQLPSQK